jgi:hypothetical protein
VRGGRLENLGASVMARNLRRERDKVSPHVEDVFLKLKIELGKGHDILDCGDFV